jgi:elongator complex protein 1
LEIYGDWLFEHRDFRQAGSGELPSRRSDPNSLTFSPSVFVQAGAVSKAMVAHEKSLDWQELFDLAGRTGVSQDDITTMGYRVSGVSRDTNSAYCQHSFLRGPRIQETVL